MLSPVFDVAVDGPRGAVRGGKAWGGCPGLLVREEATIEMEEDAAARAGGDGRVASGRKGRGAAQDRCPRSLLSCLMGEAKGAGCAQCRVGEVWPRCDWTPRG